MAWPKGFEFRQTQAYVTTASDDTYVLGSTAYPTTRSVNGDNVTFGWEAIEGDGRDRSDVAPNNPKLSGICFQPSGASADAVFRVDLTAGTYTVKIAAGDAANTMGVKLEVRDNATVRVTLSETTTGAIDHYVDATGVERTSAADWFSNNVAASVNVSSGILRVVLQRHSVSPSVISYLEINSSGGGSTVCMLPLLGCG